MPSGIAICGADLYVCDTGLADAPAGDPCVDVVALRTRVRAENHRVSVFALQGLRACGGIFGRRDPTIRIGNRLRSPATPAGAFWSPTSSTSVVHRFDPGGRWEEALSGFGAPTHIAIDCRDRLYVVGEHPGTARYGSSTGWTPGSSTRKPIRRACAPFFRSLPFAVEPSGVIDLSAQCRPLPGDCRAAPVAQPGSGRFDVRRRSARSASRAAAAAAICLIGQIPVHGARQQDLPLPVASRDPAREHTDRHAHRRAHLLRRRSLYRRPARHARRLAHRSGRRAVRSTAPGIAWCAARPAATSGSQLELKSNGAATPQLDAVEIEFPRLGVAALPAGGVRRGAGRAPISPRGSWRCSTPRCAASSAWSTPRRGCSIPRRRRPSVMAVRPATS